MKNYTYRVIIELNGVIMETEVIAKSIEEVEEIIKLNTSILQEAENN
jgi:hypothetical protein